MTERFVVYIGDTPLKRFDDRIEARTFAKMISERDETVVTLVDVFTGEETIFREFSVWF